MDASESHGFPSYLETNSIYYPLFNRVLSEDGDIVDQRRELLVFRLLTYSIASIIIISNLIVVISSGLILRKGSQCKSMFLLLGNVSLADTLVGANVFIGTSIRSHSVTTATCVVQMGIVVTPTMVSIFTVGLIAVDRYIYILHGLYYRRWINTTRVRLCIVGTWILGIILGFLPAAGWAQDTMEGRKCWFITVSPPAFLIVVIVIGVMPLLLACILYFIILAHSLRKVKQLQSEHARGTHLKLQLRIHRGKIPGKNLQGDLAVIKSTVDIGTTKERLSIDTVTSSVEIDLPVDKINLPEDDADIKTVVDIGATKGILSIDTVASSVEIDLPVDNTCPQDDPPVIKSGVDMGATKERLSIDTVASTVEIGLSIDSDVQSNVKNKFQKACMRKSHEKSKEGYEPNKWRAIKVIMLTTGSIICTWVPYLIAVIAYLACDKKMEKEHCNKIELALASPLAILGMMNSLMNPLIYAWLHPGFKKATRKIFCGFRDTPLW